MELLKALLLGFIQGATEFLPVSSSGHLVLGSQILAFDDQGIIFGVMLHLGTLVSVVIVFRKELLAMMYAPFQWLNGLRTDAVRHHLLWDIYIVVATIPAVIVGLSFKDRIEQLFTSVLVVYLMLMVTGSMMILSRYAVDRDNMKNTDRSFKRLMESDQF